MKKLFSFVLPLAFLLFISCEGDQGPPGYDGLDGVNILGSVFDVEVDFNASNNFEALVDFPNNIEVFDTDIVVVYILADVEDGLDVWEPLPQTLFFDDGILHYSFDHTLADINLFIDGTVVLGNLLPEFTQNVIFRVAILPADSAQNLDLNSIESVTGYLRHKDIIKLN